jgi:hypothetical protein
MRSLLRFKSISISQNFPHKNQKTFCLDRTCVDAHPEKLQDAVPWPTCHDNPPVPKSLARHSEATPCADFLATVNPLNILLLIKIIMVYDNFCQGKWGKAGKG